MPELDVRGVEKRFGDGTAALHALGPLDLGVDDDEVVAVVGPSGCGKTTLLRVLAGLTPPTAGTVEVGGRPLWNAGGKPARDAHGELAVVFQEANLLPWLDVAANVTLPLKLRGAGRRERRARADELCALTGLAGFERARPDALSIGMRQRAALARALVEDPRVLLLDEPFAALDAITRETMNLELQRVWMRQRCTTVLVTHSITEAVFLSDRVVSMTARPGRIAGVTIVPFERPRDVELEHEQKFQDLVRQVRSLLADAS
jgi:NitT/TauT family transport system ATP-binding protein